MGTSSDKLAGNLNGPRSPRTITADYTVKNDDIGRTLIINTLAVDVIITFPAFSFPVGFACKVMRGTGTKEITLQVEQASSRYSKDSIFTVDSSFPGATATAEVFYPGKIAFNGALAVTA